MYSTESGVSLHDMLLAHWADFADQKESGWAGKQKLI